MKALSDQLLSFSEMPILCNYEIEKGRKQVEKALGHPLQESDNVGSLYVSKSGPGFKIMVTAHMDTPSLMVTDISKDGYLSVLNIGKVEASSLVGKFVKVYGKEDFPGGYVSVRGGMENLLQKDFCCEDLIIDTGNSLTELSNKISVGDQLYISEEAYETEGFLMGANVSGAARIACLSQVEKLVVKSTVKNKIDLVYAAKGETRYLGSQCSSSQLSPAAAVIINTVDASLNATSDEDIISGNGAVLIISGLENRKMTDIIRNSTRKRQIPLQSKVVTGYQEELSGVSLSGEGVCTAVLNIPVCHLDCARQIVSLKDIESTANAVLAFLEDASKIDAEELLC